MATQKAIEPAIRKQVDQGQLAGAAALIWRNGQTHVATVGQRERVQPLVVDPLWRETAPLVVGRGQALLAGSIRADRPDTQARRVRPGFVDGEGDRRAVGRGHRVGAGKAL